MFQIANNVEIPKSSSKLLKFFMWILLLLVMILLSIVIVEGLYILRNISDKKTETPSTTNTQTTSTSPVFIDPYKDWSTYSDSASMFTLRYPGELSLQTDFSKPVPGYIPVCDPNVSQACFIYDGSDYKDTNLTETAISFNAYPSDNTQAKCTQFAGYSNLVIGGDVVIDDHIFYIANGSSAAAGHSRSDRIYRTFFNGTCLEFDTRINLVGDYSQQPITMLSNDDLAKVYDRLYKVLKSITFAK